MATSNYSITFVSLRSGTTYTVNIGGGTGAAIPLKGGAEPFMTQEDDNEDIFTPVRTQSGYLRIVDDGLDATGTAWDWHDLIPETDTSRPVTLSHVSGSSSVIDWEGFMQAQDFGSVLYGNPQEREFPIQCVLTVTQGTDINYQQTAIQNFAYLLNQIVDAIPQAQRPTQFVIQGGSYAQAWLLKKIDWQNFVDEDGDGNPVARYSMFECLEDMCKFWGWTARTKGKVLYLTCAYNQNLTSWLTMDDSQLSTMAGGTAAGTTNGTFTTSNFDILGDIFASINNDDFVQRGINKATVSADINATDKTIIDTNTDKMYRQLTATGWQSVVNTQHGSYRYTYDLLTAETNMMSITCESGDASMNFAQLYDIDKNTKAEVKEIRIKKSYDSVHASVYATIEMNYEHCYSGNWLELHGDIYRLYTKLDTTTGGGSIGQKTMIVRIGIKKQGAQTMWMSSYNTWSNTNNTIEFTIGNNGNTLYFYDARSLNRITYERFPIPDNLDGTLFIEFLGSNNLDEVDGQRSFDIANFQVVMWHGDIAAYNYQTANWWSFENVDDIRQTVKYVSKNQNKVKNEFSIDTIFASENNTLYGFGLLINSDRSYLTTLSYPGVSDTTHPEQYLADCVTSYWQKSRRRIKSELRKNNIPDITPQYKVTIDGTVCHPISISREWRDDVTILTLLEM